MIIDDFSKPKRKLTVSEASAANDYFTRRKSEEERIAGVKAPAKNKKNPANTDYAKKRKQQDVEESFGRRPDHGREERHDLDPSDWYIVKDGKMFAASIYPRQVKQAQAEGFSRTKQEARARASSQGVAEGLSKRDQKDEARTSAAQRLSNAWDRQRAKSDASLARTPGSIPKTVDKERMIRNIATSDASPEHKKVAIDAVMKTMSESRANRQALMAQMLNS